MSSKLTLLLWNWFGKSHELRYLILITLVKVADEVSENFLVDVGYDKFFTGDHRVFYREIFSLLLQVLLRGPVLQENELFDEVGHVLFAHELSMEVSDCHRVERKQELFKGLAVIVEYLRGRQEHLFVQLVPLQVKTFHSEVQLEAELSFEVRVTQQLAEVVNFVA